MLLISFRFQFRTVSVASTFLLISVQASGFGTIRLRVISPLKRLMSLSIVRVFTWIGGVGCGRNLFRRLNPLWFRSYCLINLPWTTNSGEGFFIFLQFAACVMLRKRSIPIYSLLALLMFIFGTGFYLLCALTRRSSVRMIFSAFASGLGHIIAI